MSRGNENGSNILGHVPTALNLGANLVSTKTGLGLRAAADLMSDRQNKELLAQELESLAANLGMTSADLRLYSAPVNACCNTLDDLPVREMTNSLVTTGGSAAGAAAGAMTGIPGGHLAGSFGGDYAAGVACETACDLLLGERHNVVIPNVLQLCQMQAADQPIDMAAVTETLTAALPENQRTQSYVDHLLLAKAQSLLGEAYNPNQSAIEQLAVYFNTPDPETGVRPSAALLLVNDYHLPAVLARMENASAAQPGLPPMVAGGVNVAHGDVTPSSTLPPRGKHDSETRHNSIV